MKTFGKMLCRAFSLMELMVTLIVVSIIITALAPIITKKLKSQSITVNSSGGGNNNILTDCSGLFNENCSKCTSTMCLECDITCEEGFYKNVPRCNCSSCTSFDANCATCDSIGCLSCAVDYKFENNVCKLDTVVEEYTTAGEYTFTVRSGVTKLEVMLIGGGGGGGGGAAISKTDTFVIDGDGNIPTLDDNNVLHTNTTGLFTWEIPESAKGKNVLVSACGGGGGGSGREGGDTKGGNGGAIKDVSFPMPNWSTIKIHIGGGGGSYGQAGGCSLGGGGGGGGAACNASGTWGTGCANRVSEHCTNHGYDPLYGEHGVGGGSGGWTPSGIHTGWAGQNGANGSKVGGGAGSVCSNAWGGAGGGGGAATLFYHTEYANVAAWVAPGGGGGSPSSNMSNGGAGGGGGGIGGGNGGGATHGGDGAGSGNSIFGSNYCYGGASGVAGKNGAMRITWNDAKNGASGGGAGQIVPTTTLLVTPGEVLTITVGAGGAGGAINSSGGAGGVSKIAKSNGIVLLSSATDTTSAGATGGNSDGVTVGTKGIITNGLNVNEISVDGYSNTDGNVANDKSGGAGGKITIDGGDFCSPGGGGADGSSGSDASMIGGCGGGGGAAGATGGAGGAGYVRIKYGG